MATEPGSNGDEIRRLRRAVEEGEGIRQRTGVELGPQGPVQAGGVAGEAQVLAGVARDVDAGAPIDPLLDDAQGGVALNVVDVYIGYLRRKLGTLSPEARAAVRTVRGKGFMFSAP